MHSGYVSLASQVDVIGKAERSLLVPAFCSPLAPPAVVVRLRHRKRQEVSSACSVVPPLTHTDKHVNAYIY